MSRVWHFALFESLVPQTGGSARLQRGRRTVVANLARLGLARRSAKDSGASAPGSGGSSTYLVRSARVHFTATHSMACRLPEPWAAATRARARRTLTRACLIVPAERAWVRVGVNRTVRLAGAWKDSDRRRPGDNDHDDTQSSQREGANVDLRYALARDASWRVNNIANQASAADDDAAIQTTSDASQVWTRQQQSQALAPPPRSVARWRSSTRQTRPGLGP